MAWRLDSNGARDFQLLQIKLPTRREVEMSIDVLEVMIGSCCWARAKDGACPPFQPLQPVMIRSMGGLQVALSYQCHAELKQPIGCFNRSGTKSTLRERTPSAGAVAHGEVAVLETPTTTRIRGFLLVFEWPWAPTWPKWETHINHHQFKRSWWFATKYGYMWIYHYMEQDGKK